MTINGGDDSRVAVQKWKYRFDLSLSLSLSVSTAILITPFRTRRLLSLGEIEIKLI